jgi:hypothetical protein
VRRGKKSQNLLIVHRRSVCHSRMHSTRFWERTAAFTAHRRRIGRYAAGSVPRNFFRTVGFDEVGHTPTPGPLRRTGMCSNEDTKKRRPFPRGRLFLFLRALRMCSLGPAVRSGRLRPTKAQTLQVTDGWDVM